MKLLENFDDEGIINFRQFVEKEYDDMPFVWPGFPLGVVGSLIAAGGTGKSFYALQKGLTVALGRDEVTRGGVLYLPAEDPLIEIGKRLKVISKILRFTDEEIEHAVQNFHVWSLLGRSPDLLQEEKNLLVFKENLRMAIETLKGKDRFRLIIFDTLRRFHYSDENDGGAMAKVLSVMEQICQEYQLSCLFLHHTSKAAALGGQADVQQASRGSSVLVDNIRYQEFLAPMSKEEAEKLSWYSTEEEKFLDIEDEDRSYFVRWGVSKQNYGFPVNEVWLTRESGVLVPCRIEKRKKNKGSNNGNGNGKKRGGYEE